MPVSHSHQFLWVFTRLVEMMLIFFGAAGSVTFQISCSLVAEHAQHVDRVGIALRQRLAVAHAHHLGAALLAQAFVARNVSEIFRLLRIGHVDDRRAVEFRLAGDRIDRLRRPNWCRRGGRHRRCSGRPGGGSPADRRCAPADRCSRRAACSWLRAARRPCGDCDIAGMAVSAVNPTTALARQQHAAGRSSGRLVSLHESPPS